MRPRHLILALCLASASAGLQAQFKSLWPVDGRIGVLSSGSDKNPEDDPLQSGGVDLDLHFAPILGWTQSRWLILPALDLDFNSANSILKVEDERFEFAQQLTSRGELGVAFRSSPDQRFGGRVFVEGFQAKQARNEELLYGQYNYQDSGAGLDWRRKWSLFKNTLGVSATDRRYPHWQSLDDAKRSEKDQGIVKAFTDIEWPWTSINAMTRFGLSYQSATYYNGLTIDETGTTLNAVKRKDGVLNAELGLPMSFGGLDVDLGVGGQVWDSNLNHYDSQTGTYIQDFNDFADIHGNLGLGYSFSRPWWALKSPQFTVDLDLELRQYIHRPAKDADGAFKPELERDFVRNVGVGFNSAFTDHWAFYIKANFMSAASNNEDSSSALYNYMFNTVSLGTNFSY